jgi:hypothetical protein
MEQHRLLVWKGGVCRELHGFDMDDIHEAEAADIPWCWLVRSDGGSWQCHLDGQGGEELYYKSLME